MEPVKLLQKRVAPASMFRPRFGLYKYQEGLWNLPEFYMLWPLDSMDGGWPSAKARRPNQFPTFIYQGKILRCRYHPS